MTPVGIVVSLANYRATVHYTDCPWYRRSAHRGIALPRTIKVKLCCYCRPTEEDVRSGPPEVSWYLYSPDPEARRRAKVRVVLQVVHPGPETVDDVLARRSLGWGRTPRRAGGPS